MSGLVVRESLGERRFAATEFPIAVGGAGSVIVMAGRPPGLPGGPLECGSVDGCLPHVTNYSITPCAVGVETRTWSSTKALYRN